MFIFDDFLSPVFWAVRGTRFYYADSRTFEVRIYGADGRLERIIRADVAQGRPDDLPERRLRSAPVTSAIPEQLRFQAEGIDRDFSDAWRAASRPPRLRAHDGFLVDAVGNMWVKEYLMGRDPPPAGARWWVFDSTGVLRRAVRMPHIDTRQTEENPEPVEIGDDYILGGETDTSGVERVRLFRICKWETKRDTAHPERRRTDARGCS
jgi:hypothetical protein